MASEKRLIDPEKCYCIAKAYHSDFEQNLANIHSLRELLDDCPTVEVVQKWISVKDLPLEEYEYKTVLYYDGKNVDPCLVLNGKFIDIYTDCGRYIDGVTHLMPLPQPPKGEMQND